MKVSDYIVNFLVEKKIDKVFSYIGKNAHLCDSIDKNENIENIFTVHEQGAGFATEGYARMTGQSGVCTVTSGPGATNLVTSIADCYFDSIPSVFIIGDVPPYECKQDRDIRQFGFQETDIVSIAKPITKYATAITSLDELRYKLEKAYFIAQNGRKGPVVISLPENLQFRTDFNPSEKSSFFNSEEYQLLNKKEKTIDISKEIKKTVKIIEKARRPVILIGGGVRLSNGIDELKTLLNATEIPIVYSLMGKDAISDEYKYNLGFIGNFGTRYANLTIANSDLLIVLGSRLDNLQTGRKIETFARDAKIIQVDIDRGELGIRMDIDLLINSDIKDFLSKLNRFDISLDIKSWQERVLEYKRAYPIDYTLSGTKKMGNSIISKLSKELRDDIICVDVGEHQMLVAQSLKIKDNQRVLFSGGFGTMGFALPSAIGATIATNRRVIVISGDGGFQMNIQELEVIKRRNLPIKIFIINNNSLHMVKLRQDTYLEGNSVGSKKDYSAPNFKKVAKAYGIDGYRVSNLKNITKIFKESLKTNKAQIIDIGIKADMTTVEPRLDFNRAFEDMRPYLTRDDLKKQMLIELA